jgi:hypothetical protein
VRAACDGKYDLFESTSPADHEAASALCLDECPLLSQCAELLQDTQRTWPGGPRGTWAGQLLGLKGSGRSGTCPTCESEDGNACKSPTGRTLSKAHSARVAPPKCETCDRTFTHADGRFRYCSDACAAAGVRRKYARYDAKRPSRAGVA